MMQYDLVVTPSTIPTLKRLLWAAVAALAIAGLFSIILVVARTPGLAGTPFFTELFSVALVIHVDLSVWVWSFAILMLGWALLGGRHDQHNQAPSQHPAQPAAFGCLVAAAACITLSPLTGDWEVIKSNYIPIIVNPLFFLGIGLLAASLILAIIPVLAMPFPLVATPENVVGFALKSAAWLVLMACLAFAATHLGTPPNIKGVAFYELQFWAGGHVLQFATVQMMLLAWLWLASACGISIPLCSSKMLALLMLGPVVALATPLPYFLYEVTSFEHSHFFTLQMDVGAGLSASLVGLALIWGLAKHGMPARSNRALWACLVMSLLLFAMGGLFGAAINGQNVRIPAHYHGAIVGVTLAFMGFIYLLLPKLGYRDPGSRGLAFIQPLLYGFGQLLHISGLAISGGYGVLRKNPGEVTEAARAAMGVMGLGGLLAIIGGLMFVLVVWQARKPLNR